MLSPEKIKFLRVLHGLTQTEVAKKIPCTKNYLSEVEGGKAQYSEQQSLKIINAIYVAHAEKKDKIDVKEILKDVGNVVENMNK